MIEENGTGMLSIIISIGAVLALLIGIWLVYARSKDRIPLGIFPFIAFILILISTKQNNLGVCPDGVQFIEVSRNIKELGGVVNHKGELANHWPPLYPILLAVSSGITGLDSLASGKYLNAILIALLFVIFNLILIKQNIDIFLSILINLLLLFSMPLAEFSWFRSEGPFLVILLTLYYFFSLWSQTNKIHLLIISGILSGLMVLTRYAGIGFVGGIMCYMFFFQPLSLKSKLKNGIVYTISFLLILIPWVYYSYSFHDRPPADREFVVHLLSTSHIIDVIRILGRWVFPSYSIYFKLIVFAFISILLVVYIFPKRFIIKNNILKIYTANKNYSLLLLNLIIVYILFLFISISFFDAHIPLNNRMLSPIFPFLIFLFIPFFSEIYKYPSPALKRLFLLSLTVIITGMFISSFKYWHDLYLNGYGYTRKVWRNSETIKNIEKFEHHSYFTNGDDVLKLYLSNKTEKIQSLPKWIDSKTLKENASFEYELTEMKKSVETGESILVYFDNITWRYYYPKKEKLLELFGDLEISNLSDGVIIQTPTSNISAHVQNHSQ